jgi:hypothetical protein
LLIDKETIYGCIIERERINTGSGKTGPVVVISGTLAIPVIYYYRAKNKSG